MLGRLHAVHSTLKSHSTLAKSTAASGTTPPTTERLKSEKFVVALLLGLAVLLALLLTLCMCYARLSAQAGPRRQRVRTTEDDEEDEEEEAEEVVEAPAKPPARRTKPLMLRGATVASVEEALDAGAPYVGQRVQLIGLSQPSWNGKVGIASAFSFESGRYTVEVDDGQLELAIRPTNLMRYVPGRPSWE